MGKYFFFIGIFLVGVGGWRVGGDYQGLVKTVENLMACLLVKK